MVARLNTLEEEMEVGSQPDEDAEEDEDGVEPDGVRNIHGVRQLDVASDDDQVPEPLETDDSDLSEYEDRRRMRVEERRHGQRQRRAGIIWTSIRLERLAYEKTVSRGHHADLPTDISETLERYDARLAAVGREVAQHGRLASQLGGQCESSLWQARSRRKERARVERVMEQQRRQQERRRRRELKRQQREAEEARATQQKLDRIRREEAWLTQIRESTFNGSCRRQVLGEISTANYPQPQVIEQTKRRDGCFESKCEQKVSPTEPEMIAVSQTEPDWSG